VLVVFNVVKAIRTIKLKVSGSTKADGLLDAWLKAVNWLSEVAFKTEELNSNRLAKAHYANLRELGLPSQLACSICKTVCATYKTAKANKRWRLAKFTRAIMPVVWKRDFNRTKKGVTLWGELLAIKDSRPLPDTAWKDSKLKRVGKQWYLILTHEIEIPEPKTEGCIVGVDMGIKRMLVATNSANAKPFFYHGGELNHRRSCIRRTRAAVQSVGTKNSRRLLRRMSGNEAAVTGVLLHTASKALVSYAVEVGARRIVVEDLANIRDSSLSKGKDLRSKVHRWPYADMRFKIAYKAAAVGIELEAVSPRNTSRGCSACGYVSASNRKGLHFCCQKCGTKDDADRQASKNIRARSVSIASNAAGTGILIDPINSELPISALECSVIRHSGVGVGSGSNPRAFRPGIL
jgi:putative transposase